MILLRAGLAAFILYLALIQPNHPHAFGWGLFRLFPLELPALLLGAYALGSTKTGSVFRIGATVVLVGLMVLKGADVVSFNALSRGFNPVSDLALIEAFVRLLHGAIGPVLTGLAFAGALIATVAAAAAIWWSLWVWARLPRPAMVAGLASAAALASAVFAVAEIGHTMGRWALPFDPPGSAFTTRIAAERTGLIRATLTDLRAFQIAARADPFTGAEGLFSAVDRDVIVIFVESYGRTSLDTPFYADLHRETLTTYQRQIEGAGLSTRSGIVTSPTQGGQSWLAHSTFANGLWVTNQSSYAAVLASHRQTLFHYGAEAGLRTAVVMPQITLEWPEVETMGFDTVLVSDDLGYAGEPFNWVTMPDQFSLAAMDRLLRSGQSDVPLLAQIALVSSHAPWLPVPEILPWDEIGDGTVYNDVALSGDSPAVVWRDYDRVREQYRLAVDYALQSVFEYALLHAADPPLLIIVGDHQAAEFIALDDRAEVPIHIVGPAHLVQRLDQAAPYAGLVPADGAPALGMAQMRDVILRALAEPLAAEVAN